MWHVDSSLNYVCSVCVCACTLCDPRSMRKAPNDLLRSHIEPGISLTQTLGGLS